jgi:hypothetical protein
LLTPAGVAGAAVELAWASTHLALYLFGLFGGPDGNEGRSWAPTVVIFAYAKGKGLSNLV